MKPADYRDLVVWQKSMLLVEEIYVMTKRFPDTERYGLALQMQRSAVSIPSNIAEGSRRGSQKDYRRFLRNAFGSGAELETQVEIAQRLSYGAETDWATIVGLLDEVMRMLNRITANLRHTTG